jgi:iron complex outermembrane receptor protein
MSTSSKNLMFVAITASLPAMWSPAASASEAPAAEDADSKEEIVVVGSRIARPEIDSNIPIAVLGSEALRLDSATNIQDALKELPQIGIGTTRANSNFAPTGNGAATIDLRNLGPSRTLVLVNGRRVVAGFPGTSAVDLNTIPSDFIERVEVVTGGTSAIYGSDAVTGVVNIVLKDKVEGIAGRAEYGLTSRGDNARYLLSATAGSAWGPEGRGRVALNLTYEDDDGLMSRDRELSKEDRFLSLVGLPAYSSFVPQGRFDLRTATGSAQVFTFDRSNAVVLGFPQSLAYNRNGDRRISLPLDRSIVSANVTFDVTDDVRIFLEPSYSKVRSSAMIEPYSFDWSFIYRNGELGMPITNPFIPASIQTLISDRNTDANPGNDIRAIQFRRRQNEVFDRSNDNERDTARVALGIAGSIAEDWKYDISYVFGRMEDLTATQDVDTARYRLALDSVTDPATSQIVCRNVAARAAGCVPVNLFGFNTISRAAADYVTIPRSADIENTQQVFTASMTGTLADLPAGPLGVAFGAEYRKEKSTTDWDANTNSGLGTGQRYADLVGEFDVKEVFGEARVPVLADRPGAKDLAFTAAVRFADYSTVGSAVSWNTGLEYTPVDGLKLRANYAQANRAPNIAELYASITSAALSGATVIDPCSGTTATSTRPQDATCRAIPGLLQEASANGGAFTYSSFDINFIGITEGGNPALQEETAKTFTAGAVITPDAMPGFNLSIDYFDIEVDDAVGSLPAQILVNRCIETGDPLFCRGIQRFPTGKLFTISTNLLNVAVVKTRGVDLNLGYGGSLGLAPDDRFGINLYFTRLLALEKQSFAGGPIEENLGQLNAAGRLGTGFKNKANARLTYQAGPITASWQINYLGSIQDTLGFTASGPDKALIEGLNRVGDVVYHDMQVRFAAGKDRDYEVYAGVNNVFDRDPPLIPAGFASSVPGVETADVYDPYGRRFYAGIAVKF